MKKTVIAAIVAIFLIAFVPLFVLKDAEFGGSDDAGSVVVEEVDSSYEPWATPVFEQLLGGELPGEVESSPFLYPDRYRSRNYRLYNGTFCRTQKMDEGSMIKIRPSLMKGDFYDCH